MGLCGRTRLSLNAALAGRVGDDAYAMEDPRNILPAHYEYVATDHGEHYQLERLSGRIGAEA